MTYTWHQQGDNLGRGGVWDIAPRRKDGWYAPFYQARSQPGTSEPILKPIWRWARPTQP